MSQKITFKKDPEKGSALIVILAFSAVVSMVLLSMQNFVEDDQTMTSKYALDNEFTGLLYDIKNTIGNDSFCNTDGVGLVGLKLASGTNLNSLSAPETLKVKIPGANQDEIGPGWTNSSGNLMFHSMSWEYQSTDAESYSRATALVRSRKVLYHLIIRMKRCKTRACDDDSTQYFTNEPRTDGTINANAIRIPLFMHLQANAAFNVISGAEVVSCFAEGTGAEFCEQIGAVWNPDASDVDYRCEPKNFCYYKAARPDDTCGATTKETSRYKPIIEGKGKMLPGKTPPDSPTTPVPPGDFDPDRLNIINCSWCNPHI